MLSLLDSGAASGCRNQRERTAKSGPHKPILARESHLLTTRGARGSSPASRGVDRRSQEMHRGAVTCLGGGESMATKFDVIAIGTGAGASAVAYRCRAAGWQVAVVDSRPFGGTCALRGCDPKKVLVGAAEAVDWARRMKANG